MNTNPNQAPNTNDVATILDKQLAMDNVVRGNLYNTGLLDASCVIAYRAALFAGASAEQAWEAARRQYLLILRGYANEIPRSVRRDEHGAVHARNQASRARRATQLAEACALPNPFEFAGAVSMEMAA